MGDAHAFHIKSFQRFDDNVLAFETKLSQDFRRWRQRNIDLESKYENLFKWSTMFNQMNGQLKEEVIKNQSDTTQNIK